MMVPLCILGKETNCIASPKKFVFKGSSSNHVGLNRKTRNPETRNRISKPDIRVQSFKNNIKAIEMAIKNLHVING